MLAPHSLQASTPSTADLGTCDACYKNTLGEGHHALQRLSSAPRRHRALVVLNVFDRAAQPHARESLQPPAAAGGRGAGVGCCCGGRGLSRLSVVVDGDEQRVCEFLVEVSGSRARVSAGAGRGGGSRRRIPAEALVKIRPQLLLPHVELVEFVYGTQVKPVHNEACTHAPSRSCGPRGRAIAPMPSTPNVSRNSSPDHGRFR